jgi:hypothetical protein
MLIFAGCPLFLGEDLSGILLIHLEPLSNSLGDACSAWNRSQPNANETSWVGYRDPATSDPLLLGLYGIALQLGVSLLSC